MQADPRVGVGLPLRMLIRHDSDGTHVGYLDRARRAASAFGVLLRGPRVELESDDGFVADDPGIVPGFDHV